MEMIKKMDAGGIYVQESLPITKQDDVGTMFEKLSALGKTLLLKTLPDILNGTIKPQPQDEANVTFSPNITREQEAIDWNKTAEEVDNQVRGMRPYRLHSRPMKVHVGSFYLWKCLMRQQLKHLERSSKKTKKSLDRLWWRNSFGYQGVTASR